MKLASFYFDHDGLFVIPIEHLGPEGMTAAMRSELGTRGRRRDWLDLFDRAFALYWERATELYRRAPATWFPPRRQHVAIVTDPSRVRPYSQPLKRSSWLMYESDFSPETSGVELGCYLFFHTERYGLSGNILASAVHNLAYFLVREPDEIAAFAEQAARSTRPDAASLQALADAQSWVRRLYHTELRPPALVLDEQVGKLEAADLLVPMSLQSHVKQLATTFKQDAQQVVADYYGRHAPEPGNATHAAAITAWLERERPSVLITSQGGSILWDPERPDDLDAVGAALDGIAAAAAASLRDDLEVIGGHTRRFLDALTDPDALPNPHDLDQEAGTYIHASRKLIAYDLRHPATNRLKEPSPPFERWMLGARTIHEWGHLAVDADIVRVPAERLPELAEAQGQAREALDEIIADAAPALRDVAQREAAMLGGGRSPAEAFFATLMGRMEDYRANVLARRFLSSEEMETYARANVITLAQEANVGPWLKLVRHAYEFQYLRLGGMDDPFEYFTESVWFRQHFCDAGVVTADRARALFDAVARVCDCYAIDESAFIEGALPTGRQVS